MEFVIYHLTNKPFIIIIIIIDVFEVAGLSFTIFIFIIYPVQSTKRFSEKVKAHRCAGELVTGKCHLPFLEAVASLGLVVSLSLSVTF